MSNETGNDTWRELIRQEREEQRDGTPIVAIAPLDLDLDRKFDAGYGLSEGHPFTMWSVRRVYFPVVYDGAEWIESVARDPDGKATEHFGGQ